jgi:hypothetical protein
VGHPLENCQSATSKWQAINKRQHWIKEDPARAAAMQAEAKALADAWSGGVKFSDDSFNEGVPAF